MYTGDVALKTRVTLEQFLAIPEEKPYRELMDGEVVEKPMAGRRHSVVVTELIWLLRSHLEGNAVGMVDTELRHLDREPEWVFLPDISVTLHSRSRTPAREASGPEEVLPDFAIEVLSPEDRPGRVTRKITHYMDSGVTLLWVVDPDDEQVTVWERGAAPRLAAPGERLTAAPVLPGFSVDLAALFARLHG